MVAEQVINLILVKDLIQYFQQLHRQVVVQVGKEQEQVEMVVLVVEQELVKLLLLPVEVEIHLQQVQHKVKMVEQDHPLETQVVEQVVEQVVLEQPVQKDRWPELRVEQE